MRPGRPAAKPRPAGEMLKLCAAASPAAAVSDETLSHRESRSRRVTVTESQVLATGTGMVTVPGPA
jgi:hypothetical protein